MLRLHRMLSFLACGLAISVAAAADKTDVDNAKVADAEQFLLRYQFTPGEQLRYESVSHLTQQGVVGEGAKVDTTKIVQKRLFTIGEVDENGQADASMQFEHVRMEIQSDDKEPEIFDSTMPIEQVAKKFQGTARTLAGKAPSYILHAEGTPVSDDGVEEIADGGQASFMVPLPQNEVAVDETWKVNMIVHVRLDEGVKRKITLLRTYRLKAVEDDIATITFSTSVMSSVKTPALKAQLLQATPNGEMKFDIAKGRLLRKEFHFDRMVLGALGPSTMLSAKGSTVETLR